MNNIWRADRSKCRGYLDSHNATYVFKREKISLMGWVRFVRLIAEIGLSALIAFGSVSALGKENLSCDVGRQILLEEIKVSGIPGFLWEAERSVLKFA